MATENQKFQFFAPVRCFEDVSKGDSKRRRIAGIISDEGIDSQGEAILQRGLDFAGFLTNGFYNDDHQPGMHNILGKPTSVQHFGKGDVLPDGSVAPRPLTWTEGYLYSGEKADNVWRLAHDMQGTDRTLGFSVEGSIVSREGPQGRVIGKASIQNVAVTASPVNRNCRLMPLLRSLTALEKAVTTETNEANERESLSADVVDTLKRDASREKKRRKLAEVAKKSLCDAQALKSVFSIMPEASIETALAVLKQTGLDRIAKAIEADED